MICADKKKETDIRDKRSEERIKFLSDLVAETS
jgi:hypothetical protein